MPDRVISVPQATQIATRIKNKFDNVNGRLGELTGAFGERTIPSANLFPSQVLTEGSLWNCWGTTVYTQSNADYACFEFSISEGAEYISSNYEWAENSFSAFVDSNYTKLELIKNTKQSGSGYVYAIPQGATKACVSFSSRASDKHYNKHYNKYLSDGIVYIVGNSNITDKTKDDYAEKKEYFADNLKLSGENNKTIPTVVDNLDKKIDAVTDMFITAKNLFTGINAGQYAIAWNIGDAVTTGTGADYAYGYADVEGCEKVTVNMLSMSDSYSFFTDANHKKIATSADNRIGTTRVYNVPTGAKYFYISSSNKSAWSEYGLVAFSGDADIATNPASDEAYPYNVEMYYADNFKLSTGGTIGSNLKNISKVFHVKKDGTGDFTSFVDAINEACKYMDSVVYVGPGTYDILEELGSDYVSSASSSKMGLVLKNRVHVIGSSHTVISMKYAGTAENVRQYLSAINAGLHGFTLENVRIETENVRYSVHDDLGGSGPTPYINKIINCTMIHKNGYYSLCIGGGLGEDACIEIRGCYFEGDLGKNALVYYHGNNNPQVTDAQSRLTICDNYFAQDGTFKMTKYGQSPLVSTAYVSNNSFGSAPEVNSGSVAPYDNVAIVAWNNEIRG